MNNKIMSLLVCGTIAFSSCSDFLDEVPKGSITSENYYKTEKDAISATNAIYDFLIVGYAPGGLWDKNYGGVFYNDYWVLQDLFADNAESNQASIQYTSVDNMQIDQYNEPVELLWRDFYQTIKCCNVVLDKVPSIAMDKTLQKQLLAEARFFRAMMYFDLMRMFGEVPLRIHNVEGVDEPALPRSSKKDIYNLVISDLNIAKTDLVYEERLGGGRPYAESASALLARVYLTYAAEYGDKDYYRHAIDEADIAIARFPMLENYADLFKIANRFNSEIIWGANFSAALSQGWKGAQFLVRLLPTLDGVDNSQGWENATRNLYNSFEADDLRRDVTLQYSYKYSDGSVEEFDKPYVFKYWDREAEPKGNNTEAIFPAIRSAEMYLIKAEALNEIYHGANKDAVAAIQKVRGRAGLKSDNLPTDYDGFKHVVLDEYRHEFVMEGHRWFDLIRMCSPEEFVRIVKAAKSDATPRAYHVRFPIPQREIDLSHGILTQNEGYGK